VQNISFDWIFFMYIVWNITICGVVVVSGYASHKTKMFAVVFLATIMVRIKHEHIERGAALTSSHRHFPLRTCLNGRYGPS
jgi:formate/nitrite transporter FocA (FNT family)